jgi:hypothetical protein
MVKDNPNKLVLLSVSSQSSHHFNVLGFGVKSNRSSDEVVFIAFYHSTNSNDNSITYYHYTIQSNNTSRTMYGYSKPVGLPSVSDSDDGKFLKALNKRWQVVQPVISDMSNVAITDPQDGQVLAYDSASGKWVNKAVKGEVEKVISRSTFSVEVG